MKYSIHLSLFVITILYSCSGTKHLKKDQYLLSKQTIKGNKEISKSSIAPLMRQRPNKKILGLSPLAGIYNLGYIFYDSSAIKNKIEETKEEFDQKLEKNKNNEKEYNKLAKKKEKNLSRLEKKLEEGNLIMRIGEPPSIYDSSLANFSQRLIKGHLVSQGFFDGEINLNTDTSGKRINATYTVKENEPYIVKEILYKTEDPKIDSIISASLNESLIKTNERFKEPDVSAERERLTKEIRNKGYYNFTAGYIYFNADTSRGSKNELTIQAVIQNPPGKSQHDIYTIDSVFFITNKIAAETEGKSDTTVHNKITFVSGPYSDFSEKILYRKIRIKPGEKYSQSAAEQTHKNLAGLQTFRFMNIDYDADTSNNTLNAYIKTTTLQRNQLMGETGLNLAQGFAPGPFISLNYLRRNAFHRFELLELNLRASIEGQAGFLSDENVLQTQQYDLLTWLSFPKFALIKLNEKWENYNPKTRLGGGFTFISRPEYQRSTGIFNLSYNLLPSPNEQYSFSPIDINIISTAQISDSFDLFLRLLQERGNNLILGFRNSYVSDMNASYTYNTYNPLENKKAKFTKYFIESGGTFLNIIQKDQIFGLETFRYLRGITDWRKYFPVHDNSIAARINIGIGYPYGPGKALPYEKYFFAGGPSSIRAWKFRRLGPGSYAPVDSMTNDINFRFERPGELLLQANIEYRFKIIGIWEGATFIDAGNVWNIHADPARPGATFAFGDFIKEIAVGTGVGVRLNFSFLILRLDWGIRVYDPALQEFTLISSRAISESVLNFGIGYPF